MGSGGIIIQGVEDTGLPNPAKVSIRVSRNGAMLAGIEQEVGALGPSKNRLFTGNPATRQKFTWAPGEGPTTIFMKVVAAKIASGALPAVLMTFDAETDIVANTNLAQTGTKSTDVQHEYFESRDSWIRQDFDTPLERLDFITAFGIIVEFRVKGV